MSMAIIFLKNKNKLSGFKFNSRISLILLFALLFIFFCIISFIPDATAGGGDDISHYNIARGAIKYPRLFLDLWGKPVFTFLSSPFAQFGIHGMQLFNILLGLITAYLLVLIARELGYKNAWLVVPFTCFAPLYMSMMSTGMTEILFGFFLVISAYLFFKDRDILSAVLISFLPFVRNEGIIIIPLYFCAFMIFRKWKAIPFLFTGTLILTIAGYFYYKDWIWIIHKWPYGDTSGIYGHGDFLFFIKQGKWILGIPLIILFLAGLIINLYRFLKNLKLKLTPELKEFLVILGPLVLYLFAHSYAWWKGTLGSGGLTRFMTAIIPLTAIYSLQGFNSFVQFIARGKIMNMIATVIVLIIVVRTSVRLYPIPYQMTVEQKLAKEASGWLKENALGKAMIYYCDPHIQYFLGADYYDRTIIRQYLPNPQNPSRDIPEGSYIAWDAHYLANEGMVSRSTLISDPALKLVRSYQPDDSITTLGGYNYEILIFMKGKSSPERDK
jgi:hypothetical protein